jgi:hypothetical protein
MNISNQMKLAAARASQQYCTSNHTSSKQTADVSNDKTPSQTECPTIMNCGSIRKEDIPMCDADGVATTNMLLNSLFCGNITQ